MAKHLLEIQGLKVQFKTPLGTARAVDDVSLELGAGETLGLVGESGCGKSVTALSVLGLVPSPPGRVTAGKVLFKGKNLIGLSKKELRHIRGHDIAMIFQEPLSALNPVLPIGLQVAEPLIEHKNISRSAAYAAAARWLDRVRIPDAQNRLQDYPHQLSGGMQQRVMVAMAMVCRPELLIADEPTTALDVTIQAQILSLMTGLKEKYGTTMLLITHDLGIIAQMATRIAVMYAGQLVEAADVEDLFNAPFHPYTQGLLKCTPRMGMGDDRHSGFLTEIPGRVPPSTHQIQGCKFSSRCAHVFDRCHRKQPVMEPIAERHQVRCWLMHYPEQRRRIG